jgi:hypothetical protein
MATFLLVIFYTAMVGAALIVEILFSAHPWPSVGCSTDESHPAARPFFETPWRQGGASG